MSKTTKIIAALGVVAGLGVAALPAFTYAADPVSVDGAVKIDVEVQPAIAMTIQSDNDDSTTYFSTSNAAFATAKGITGQGYEEYTKSEGTFTNFSSATTSLLPNAKDETMNSVVTVYTNNAAGYTLSVEDADNNNSLVSGSNSIAPISATGRLAAGTAAWGINGGDLVNSEDDSETGLTFYAVPVHGNALTAKANGLMAQNGEATTFHYGVATSPTQAQGTYTDTIIYTATTKNAQP